MIATVKIDGIFYNANDTKIYHWHSLSGIRFGEHVELGQVERHNLITLVSINYEADKRIKKNSHQGTFS